MEVVYIATGLICPLKCETVINNDLKSGLTNLTHH